MSDQPNEPQERLPVPRPEAGLPAERFTAPPSARRFGLSPERAAQIVRQTGSARSVAFLFLLLTVVFVISYFFYDTGVPGVAGGGREVAAQAQLQVTEVQTGYALFEANCARCHGAKGQGYIGPALNDQMKLSAHLTAQYLQNVLTVGGRYVCGDANSLMPVWADTNGGPLNYQQILDIIAFIRAPNTVSFQATDPATGKTVTMQGWRDPTYVPPAKATPFPACYRATPAPGGAASGSPGASGSASAGQSAAPSGSAAAGPSGNQSPTALKLTAQNIAFNTASLSAPANQAFSIDFTNNDAGVPHNVTIKSQTGQQVFGGDTFAGTASRTYQVPSLPAGTYTFFCSVHPNMSGTLTVK